MRNATTLFVSAVLAVVGGAAASRSTAAGQGTSSPTIGPVSISPDSVDRLSAAIEKLNGLLEQGGIGAAKAAPSMSKFKGPGYPSVDALWKRFDEQVRPNTNVWDEALKDELFAAHFAWTRDDIVERYGIPASLEASDHGIDFIYSRGPKLETSGHIRFYTSDRLVTSVRFY